MNKAVPWSIKGVDFDAREAAKAAARRDGVSLGEWMNQAIVDRAAETGLDAEDFDAEERLEAVAAQLARLSREAEDEPPPRRRRSGIAGANEDSARREAPPRPRRSGQREPLAREPLDFDEPPSRVARLSTPQRSRDAIDAESLLEQAVKAFENRAGRTEARTVRAIENVAQMIETAEADRVDGIAQLEGRLVNLETQLRRKPRVVETPPDRSAIERLEQRIEALSAREPEPADDAALRQLDRKLSHILARMERVEDAPAGPARDEQFGRLEKRFDALLTRLDRSTPHGGASASRPVSARPDPSPAAAPRRDFNNLVADIGARQRDLDAGDAGMGRPGRPVLVSDRPVDRAADRAAEAIDARLEALARKLDAAASRADAPRDDARIDRLQHGIESLSGRIEDMRREFAASAARKGPPPSVEGAVRDLASRIESARATMLRSAETRQPATSSAEIEALSRQVAAMSRALADVAPRNQMVAVEKAVRSLGDQIARSRNEGMRDAVLAPIESLAADVRRAISEAHAHANLEGVTGLLREVEGKVDDLRRYGAADRSDFKKVLGQSDELRAMIASAMEQVAPMERMERQIADLSERLESIAHHTRDASLAQEVGLAQSAAGWRGVEARLDDLASRLDSAPAVAAPDSRFDELSGRLDSIHQALASRLDSAPVAAAPDSRFDELSRRLDSIHQALASRLDRAPPAAAPDPRFDDLSHRLEFVHQALAARIDGAQGENSAPTPPSNIEPLLRSLADKMERAMSPQADSGALEALERQIARVSEKLDSGDASANQKLERAIDDLTARLDHSREYAQDVAEAAARNALRGALSLLPRPEADVSAAVGSELADLRQKQENLDRRAQQTLSAVHETLEKVVDRLAMLEQDVHEAPLKQQVNSSPAKLEQVKFETAKFDQGKAEPAKAEPSKVALAKVGNAAPLSMNAVSELLTATGGGRSSGARRPESTTSAGPSQSAANASGPRLSASRDDEVVVGLPASASYIEAARRALAARAAAETADKQVAEQQKGANSASAKPSASTPFVRPLAVGEKAVVQKAAGEKSGGARRLPTVLSMAGLVLALGAYQTYRTVEANAVPPAPMAAPEAQHAAKAAEHVAPAPALEAAQPQAANPAPAALDPTNAPAMPGAKQARGSGLIDPLSVGAIGPRANTMASVAAGAQLGQIKDMAEKGDSIAQYDLGARLLEGRGIARDPVSAIGWLEKSAAQGLPESQYRLGAIYEKGIGTARDAGRARDYYAKAAAQGHIRAMHNLAVIEAEGVDGKPDYADAAQWFRRAADFGVRDSQYNLAILYARGMGVMQNMTQSYVWFAAAAAQGDDDAAKKRDEIAARLDAPMLEAAKKQAAAFRPRVASPGVNEPPVFLPRAQTSQATKM